MPKTDVVRRIDLEPATTQPIYYVIAGERVREILSAQPAPLGGQVYIAPWAILAQSLNANDTVLRVKSGGARFEVGNYIVLSHFIIGNEMARIAGGPETFAEFHEYTLERTDPRTFPANETYVFDLGNATDGGYITIVSGDQDGLLRAPHVNVWQITEGGVHVRKARLGRLSGLDAAEKARFPQITDWNRFGLFADDALLRGVIIAEAGEITGNLKIGGTLDVYSGYGRAGLIVGHSEAGYGFTMFNSDGHPVFAAVSPYIDEHGQFSDVAVFVDNDGRKGLYYHRGGDGRYRLEIGVDTLVDGKLQARNILAGDGELPDFTGVRLGSDGIFTYGLDHALQVEIDARDGRLYFGRREGWLDASGIAIDARNIEPGTDELEHTVHWLASSSTMGDYVTAAIGSPPRGGWFAHTRRPLMDVMAERGEFGAQAIDAFIDAYLHLNPGHESTLFGYDVTIAADGRLRLVNAGRNALVVENNIVEVEQLEVGEAVVLRPETAVFGGRDETGARVIIVQDPTLPALSLRHAGSALHLHANGKIEADHILVAANAIKPTTANVNIGTPTERFRHVYAEHGHFGSLGSQTALVGSFYLTHRRGTLMVPLEADNDVAYFRESDLRVGEFLRFEDEEGNVEVIGIAQPAEAAGEFYEYAVTRGLLGDPRLWPAGSVGVSLGGNAQDGYIRLWGTDDQDPLTGPSIVIFERVGDTITEVAERAVFGNLSGFYHFPREAKIYGAAFGDKDNIWSAVTPESFRIYRGAKPIASYGEEIILGNPYEDVSFVHIMPDQLELRGSVIILRNQDYPYTTTTTLTPEDGLRLSIYGGYPYVTEEFALTIRVSYVQWPLLTEAYYRFGLNAFNVNNNFVRNVRNAVEEQDAVNLRMARVITGVWKQWLMN